MYCFICNSVICACRHEGLEDYRKTRYNYQNSNSKFKDLPRNLAYFALDNSFYFVILVPFVRYSFSLFNLYQQLLLFKKYNNFGYLYIWSLKHWLLVVFRWECYKQNTFSLSSSDHKVKKTNYYTYKRNVTIEVKFNTKIE